MVFVERGRTPAAAGRIQQVAQLRGVNVRSNAPRPTETSVAGAFAELGGNIHFLATAVEADGDGVAGTFAIQYEVDVVLRGNILTVNGDDDVTTDGDPAHASLRVAIASMNSGDSGRPAASHAFHQQAFLHGQIQSFTEPAAHGQSLHAEESAVNLAVGDEIAGDALCRVDRN